MLIPVLVIVEKINKLKVTDNLFSLLKTIIAVIEMIKIS